MRKEKFKKNQGKISDLLTTVRHNILSASTAQERKAAIKEFRSLKNEIVNNTTVMHAALNNKFMSNITPVKIKEAVVA